MNGLAKLTHKTVTNPLMVYRAFRGQLINWRDTISPTFRFMLFGIFSFMAYFIFTNLGTLKVDMLNQLAAVALFEIVPFIITILLIILGYTALLCSLIAAKLGESLLSDPI